MPPQAVVDALDAPPTPAHSLSPDRSRILLVGYEPHPPIAVLSRPVLRLGGVRVDPRLGARQRTTRFTSLSVIPLAGDPAFEIDLPPGSSVGSPVWSPDGRRLAFTRDAEDGVELWVADAATGAANAVGVRMVDIIATGAGGVALGTPSPLWWTRDSAGIYALAVPEGRGAPPLPSEVPDGPRVEETAGKTSQMPTFQDLLRNEADEALFEHFATSQLTHLDVTTGNQRRLGQPGLITSARPSPDGNHLLVHRLKRPFSFRVPFAYFARSTEVWATDGQHLVTVADLPVSDEIPRQGVPLGPRSVMWDANRPATLVWVEALDGGDPRAKVPHRERVLRLELELERPDGSPGELFRIAERFNGWHWMDAPDAALVVEHDRDRRWRTTAVVDLSAPAESRRVLFDLSVNDAYANPGSPVHTIRPDGQRVVLQDGEWIYLIGPGATERGYRPFVDRCRLADGATERLWQCDNESYELPLGLTADGTAVITRRETPTQPPNFFVVDLATNERRQLTDLTDPHPDLTGAVKQLIRYERHDGVELSGTLYLPPGRTVGDGGPPLPTLVWAYPMDYSDPATAGQVRGSDLTFTRLQGDSPLWLLREGFALLMNATMPVVGDPETMNDTFVEQVVGAAEAAVDTLVELGVADRARMVASGHSYGGFMTATLLAHSDLFVAGIARSGAYNRSLTPFGFQTERRSYWEVPEIYQRVSPFTYAHQITAPLLLIHGEADNNSGTFPIQSERLFQAIQGNGGTARLVILPCESHGYRARESILHVIAETFAWAARVT
jgi:dipeptidyl aminopeptidase/acylaminoacyl peptidase